LDKEDHEAECKILQSINKTASQSSSSPDIPTEAIRDLGRICLNRKKARSNKGKEPEWVRFVLWEDGHWLTS
jgi:hypothetical protein